MRPAVIVVAVLGMWPFTAPADTPAPPKGAQYTIFCSRVEGPAHVERAGRLKSELMNKSGLSGWYVVHEDHQSLLYHGFYRSFNDSSGDRKETARAQADIKRVKGLTLADGARPFGQALFVDLEAPDPVAPPEWNLINAEGAWSIQIAAYKDSPLRKEAAVQAVREARQQGVQAYYYHGDTVSSVCIGVWPEAAVNVHDTSKAVSPHDEAVVVAPSGIPEIERELAKLKEGQVKVVQERVEVVDPTLMAAMKQYPYHAVNGMQMTRIVNGQQVIEPSLLIRVPEPKESDSALSDDPVIRREPGEVPFADEQQQPPRRQPPPEQPGLGKLKSVDD